MKYFVHLLILMFLQAVTCYAEEVIPVYADYSAQPKSWQTDKGEAKGIQVDLLKEVTKRTGIKFTFHFAPWKRVYSNSEQGRGGIIGFSKSEAREKHWDYSVPLYYDELVFVTVKDKQFSFSGLESLKGKKIAIKRGARYGDDFEKAIDDKLFAIVETESRVGQMQMLTRGRVDVVLLSPGKIALENVISQNKWLQEHHDDFTVISPPYKSDPNYLGIPKSMNKKQLLAKINSAINEIRVDGTYNKISNKVMNEVIEEINREK